jgi:Spy/CpxP family protein refolding chaperone
MRSTRLATAAVTAGAALLGWSAVSVAAIGDQLPAPSPGQQQQQPDRSQSSPHQGHCDHDHDRRPGV